MGRLEPEWGHTVSGRDGVSRMLSVGTYWVGGAGSRQNGQDSVGKESLWVGLEILLSLQDGRAELILILTSYLSVLLLPVAR